MAGREELQIVTMQGPVTVAYREIDGLWHATALEFDLVGTGPDRDAAFAQLRELVSDYLEAFIESARIATFHNPAAGEEWATPDKERYQVIVVVASGRRRPPTVIEHPKDLRKYRNRLRDLDIVPAVC